MFARVISFIILLGIAYSMSITNSGCANIVPPVGGPRDSLPPKLLKVLPADKATNVTSNKIVLEFDEYIQLEDALNKIIISPLPKIQPDVTGRLKTVTIKLKDSLEANTTYSVAINGAIKDVNESNKLNDLVYTFSTGTYIDSNTIKGKVILAETGKIDTNLIVVLHPSHIDSAVAKEKPKYVTKLNNQGEFEFKNLPPKTYSIYTLADEGGQKRYMSEKQLFGFYDTLINAAKNPQTLTLFAYIGEKELPKTVSAKINPIEKVKLTNSLTNGQQDLLKDLVLTSNKPLTNIDSSLITLTDTTYQVKYTFNYTIDSTKKIITLKNVWSPEAIYRLVLPNNLAKDDKGGALFTKSDTLKFTAKSRKDYGKIVIRFNNVEFNKNPVLQIIQNDQIINSHPLTSLKLDIAMYNPGEYDLRLLTDDNKNGKWDAGTFFGKKKQPEKVIVLPKKLSVRADWDNELEIE
jgi:Bacterial Ig-like domain